MKFDIVRAWKDEEYRKSLSEEELCSLPENPVGELELSDADLEAVYGGGSAKNGCSNFCHSVFFCNSFECHSFQFCNSFICSFICH